ncbi:6203_t:CDS:2 [Racocetra persica]|uniref:6203_t:CDS:1 n=1 Tax=Racocetra persica TaxID=160502 RepID=A0ACA9QHS6_9GLOM|nr:6203_t:CDS:2 [Racocetra persica]
MYDVPMVGKDRKKLRIRLYIPQSLEILSNNERSLLNAQKSKESNEIRYIPYIPSLLNPNRPELLRCVIDYYPSKRHENCIYKTQQRKKRFTKKTTSKSKTFNIINNKKNEDLKTQYNNGFDYDEPITQQNIKVFHHSLIQRPRTTKQNLTPEQVLHSARDELGWRRKTKIKFNTKFANN